MEQVREQYRPKAILRQGEFARVHTDNIFSWTGKPSGHLEYGEKSTASAVLEELKKAGLPVQEVWLATLPDDVFPIKSCRTLGAICKMKDLPSKPEVCYA